MNREGLCLKTQWLAKNFLLVFVLNCKYHKKYIDQKRDILNRAFKQKERYN